MTPFVYFGESGDGDMMCIRADRFTDCQMTSGGTTMQVVFDGDYGADTGTDVLVTLTIVDNTGREVMEAIVGAIADARPGKKNIIADVNTGVFVSSNITGVSFSAFS